MENESNIPELAAPTKTAAGDMLVTSQTTEGNYSAWQVLVALALTGVCVGWLAGMSVSPVISGILTTIVATAGAVVAAATGLQALARPRLWAWPLAIFVIAIVPGSILGIWTRTSNLLGADPLDQEIARWTKHNVYGIDPDLIIRRAFLQTYPPAPAEFPLMGDIDKEVEKWKSVGITDTTIIGAWMLDTASSSSLTLNGRDYSFAPDDQFRGVFMQGIDSDACQAFARFLRANGYDYQDAFEKSAVLAWQDFAVIADTAALKQIYEKVLCPAKE